MYTAPAFVTSMEVYMPFGGRSVEALAEVCMTEVWRTSSLALECRSSVSRGLPLNPPVSVQIHLFYS